MGEYILQASAAGYFEHALRSSEGTQGQARRYYIHVFGCGTKKWC